jgi:outer membrane receptor for ferrienterochelin and colicins
VVILLGVALAGAAPGSPEAASPDTCQTLLQDASAHFAQGRFSAAEAAIAECLETDAQRAEKVQAYSLLAKIHLALDDLAAAEAALRRLLDAEADYEPGVFDSQRFVRLLAEVKSARYAPVVTSVSKSQESLVEAPATVVVVTAEDIERRGYINLEAVLHDLPGFDFSRRAGASYANIYQRGYRSIETNRTLILVDLVEDNDLASGTAWISRQIPLSNIERIEVVYGPASTMYGANAFAGVINIMTKGGKALAAEGNRVGYDARLSAGSWDTRFFDATIGGQSPSGTTSWSITARRYTSNDFDHLRNYEEWDYDTSFYDSVDYRSLGSLNVTDPAEARAILEKYSPELVSRYYDVVTDEQGQVAGLSLNAAGDERARSLDQGAYARGVNGSPVEFGVPVDDWQIHGKLRMSNFELGLMHYRREEASHIPLVDTFAATGKNGFLWTPKHTFLYAKYSRRFLDDRLSLTSFTRYKQHSLDGTDSADVLPFLSYQLSFLGVENLLQGTEPVWPAAYSYRSNNQLRTELNAFYEHSRAFGVVGGGELRWSSIGARNIGSSTPPAGETGSVSNEIAGGNQISSRDIGAYAQASWRPWNPLKLVGGVRLDNNKIRDTGGYGSVFNTRVAGVYRFRDFTFKAIYSEAFQDAPNFQKFETVEGLRELDNPNLAPEEVSNFELSANWSPRRDLSVELVSYWADYEGIVEEVSGVPCPEELDCETTNQFQNVGRLDINGLLAQARWTPGRYDLWANYTYADPFDPDRGVRVGDIASQRINLVGTATLLGNLDVGLRFNWVLGRLTGANTTVDRNPFDKIDDYAVLHLTAAYRLPWGLDLRLSVDNVLDTEYFDPALRNPSGFPIAARVPQPGRIFFVQLRARR